MKKIMVFLIVAIMLTSAAYATRGLPASGANIRITMVNQDPDPVEPGKYVDVRFKVENYGSDKAEDIELEILPSYPFSLEPGDDAIQAIGTLQARQTDDVGEIVKYRLRVDNNAIEGPNDIKVRYQVKGSGWIELPEFSINVRSYDAILNVISVVSNPEIIEPGKRSELSIKMKNIADLQLEDIKVKLDLADSPFAPIGSTNQKIIEHLATGMTTTVGFDLISKADSSSGAYLIPLEIGYKDKLGNNYSIESSLGLRLGSVPDISVTKESTTLTGPNMKGTAVIQVVNKGISDVKFVNMKIEESPDFDLMSRDEIYLGNIDSDDYESAEITLFAKQTDKGSISIPVKITYKDANNKDYTKKVDVLLKFPLHTDKNSRNSYIGILIAVAVVIIGFLVYIRLRKKKSM